MVPMIMGRNGRCILQSSQISYQMNVPKYFAPMPEKNCTLSEKKMYFHQNEIVPIPRCVHLSIPAILDSHKY